MRNLIKRINFSPIVFSGPSGAGKTELIDYIVKRDPIFEEASGMTTRKRRPGEEGNTQFVTKEDFRKAIHNGELIQYAEYNGNYYGTSKSALSLLQYKQMLFNMGYDGTMALKKIRPDSLLIYILPPTKEELLKRMGDRGKERYAIGRDQTMKSIGTYDYLLISYTNSMDELYEDFMNIFEGNEKGKEKSLQLSKNRDFMRKFYN